MLHGRGGPPARSAIIPMPPVVTLLDILLHGLRRGSIFQPRAGIL
jgi:hypothetical protein